MLLAGQNHAILPDVPLNNGNLPQFCTNAGKNCIEFPARIGRSVGTFINNFGIFREHVHLI